MAINLFNGDEECCGTVGVLCSYVIKTFAEEAN